MTKHCKAREDGICAACHATYAQGDRIVWTRPVHSFCVHAAAFTSIPPAPTLEFTRLKALDMLEEAIKSAAAENGVTDEMEKQWGRYERLKAVALAPGSAPEGRQAFRMALKSLIELAYP